MISHLLFPAENRASQATGRRQRDGTIAGVGAPDMQRPEGKELPSTIYFPVLHLQLVQAKRAEFDVPPARYPAKVAGVLAASSLTMTTPSRPRRVSMQWALLHVPSIFGSSPKC